MECNRNCDFCSYSGADRTQSLPFDFIRNQVTKAVDLGVEGLKISGGGEPLLYSRIISLLCLAKYYNLFVHLQTNGDELSFIHWKYCDDVRISFSDISDNCRFESSKSYYTHGFSYVVTSEPDYDNLNRVVRFAIANDKYCKITQDDTDLENVPDIDEIKEHIPESNNIYFWDAKDYHAGENPCPECMTNPLLGADGYYYPCCRTQYAKGKDLKGYDITMRLGQDITTMTGYDGSDCVRCYY